MVRQIRPINPSDTADPPDPPDPVSGGVVRDLASSRAGGQDDSSLHKLPQTKVILSTALGIKGLYDKAFATKAFGI